MRPSRRRRGQRNRRHRQQSHPVPADIAIVIEVADSTLADDRRIKARLYARAAIPEYWIVNLVDRRVEIYSDPTGPTAAPLDKRRHMYGIRKSVSMVIDGVEVARIAAKELFP